MVIAKSFKDSELSIFILFIFLVIVLTIGIVAATYIPILLLKILIICITSILLLLTFYIPYFVYKQRKQQEDVILYDNIKEKFVINYHNKTVIINKNEIIRITNHNLCIDKTSLFLARQNYGKKFFLK